MDFFFFSSRRRHTRWTGDWSSDVCSSDLITFGRQNTVLADGIAKYDPNYASQAFSYIGISGGPAGGGDTQNRRLDSSVKYVGSFKPAEGVGAHLSAQYKFNQSTGSANTAYEVSFGGDYAGFSAD